MKLYKTEFMKILKRKSTWILIGLMLLLVIAIGQIEIYNKQNMIINFGQLVGYRRFLDLLEFFLICAFLVEIIVLASFYCEDRQDRVSVLILTTKKGKLYDYVARVQVTITFIICLNIMMIMAAYVICYVNYGYNGGNLLVKEMHLSSVFDEKSVFVLIRMYLFNVFNASIVLGTLVACISVRSKNSMYSFLVIVGLMFLPVMLENIFRNGEMNIGYTLVTSGPILLITRRCFMESGAVYGWHIFVIYIIVVVTCFAGGKKWCSVPKE